MLAAAASLGAMRSDVFGQAGEAGEDPDVVFVVGAQLEAEALGNDQRDLEDVDRVEAQAIAVAVPVKRGVGADFGRGDIDPAFRAGNFRTCRLCGKTGVVSCAWRWGCG